MQLIAATYVAVRFSRHQAITRSTAPTTMIHRNRMIAFRGSIEPARIRSVQLPILGTCRPSGLVSCAGPQDGGWKAWPPGRVCNYLSTIVGYSGLHGDPT